jgi:hypothetical protein
MRKYRLDLRKELRQLRETLGFRWVALRSVDLTKPCTECQKKVPDNYDSGFAGCKSCMNIGYSYIDRLVRGYKFLGSQGLRYATNVGMLNDQEMTFILQHDATPKPVDWILELDLDETTLIPRQPFKVIAAYKIDDAHPQRGEDGRIEFWKCKVDKRVLGYGKSQ